MYLVLDWVSYVHPILPLGITPWNPPPGLSVALLLTQGARYIPALVVAPLLAEVIVRDIPAPLPTLVASSVTIAAGYSVAVLTLRRLRFDAAFNHARDLILYAGVMGIASMLVALTYVGVFRGAGLIAADQYVASVARYWIGDINGVLVFAPALLVLHHARERIRVWRPTLEVFAQCVAFALVFWIIFGIEATDERRFFYLLFLPLIWVAMRHGIIGTALALAGIQAGLIVIVQSRGYQTTAFIDFQLLMLTLCATGLLLGAVVTQRRRTEQALAAKQIELNQALQFAAAGEMTAALAHELNNPIAAVVNYTRAAQLLAQAQPLEQARLLQTLDKAAQETKRASEVVHRLRELFRSGATRLRWVTLGELMAELNSSIQTRLQRHHVQIKLQLDVPERRLHVDPLQIQTILHNLIANAIDVLSQQPPERTREIVLSSECREETVRLRVADNGPGIAAEILPKLFEPFSSNKARGMGLGLAISRGMAQAHGGTLTLLRSDAQGATFEVVLPTTLPESESAHD